jgi:hypothetical protein
MAKASTTGWSTRRLAAELLARTIPNAALDYQAQWPAIRRAHYGTAFSIARRLAGLLTVPGFLTTFGPVGMRSRFLMTIAFGSWATW